MKIGIVNDTEMAARAIAAALDSSGDHRVAWTARSGPEAIRLCRDSLPDLVLMDLVMPGMNGAAATREIMGSTPTAILVVTASVSGNCGLAFEAMGAGALDVIATPSLVNNDGRTNFLLKISQIGAIITDRHMPAVPPPRRAEAPAGGEPGATDSLVAIGCSAGGPAALSQILGELDPLARAAVVLVQHIDARFVDELAAWLGSFGKNPLEIAAGGAPIEPGRIYLAGKDGHLEACRGTLFRYETNLGGRAYQPSVDVFLSSVARTWRGRAMGAVLTGMGRDGAAGLRAMREAGFLTIAQDEKSSALFGMPKAAAPFASEILPLSSISQRINRWIQTSR